MRTVRNHNSHAKEYSPQSSSSIRFSPRGDAFKHPVQHYDVAKVRSVSEALEAFNATSFQSRKLGQSYKIWLKMLNDPERPMIFFGLSGDRKSTRLNSSHITISYAVFCLKKKK